MGAKQCRPPVKPIKKHVCVRELTELKLKTTPTLSSTSMLSVTEGLTVDTLQTPSQRFDDDYMEQILQRYTEDLSVDKEYMSQLLIKDVMLVMESLTLDEHVHFIASQFTPMYLTHDSLIRPFRECRAGTDSQISKFPNIEHKLTLHNMYVLRLHRVFLTTFEDGKDERVYELLNYIALSHLILNVPPRLFRERLVLTIKNLIHFNLITEEQLPHFVYYHMHLIDHICEAMENYRMEHMLAYEIDQTTGAQTTCRKYYRELKKWKAILANIRKSLAKPITTFEKRVEEGDKNIALTKSVSDLNWKCTRMLMKGYKFKKFSS